MDIAQLLVERGANIEQPNEDGHTPLLIAIQIGNEQMVRMLLAHGANQNVYDEFGDFTRTALHHACLKGCLESVQVLLDAGADINLQRDNDDGETALMAAAQLGYMEIVRVLLDAGGDVNLQDNDGCTALFEARGEDITRLLLDRGAHVDHQDNDGRTPLESACRRGHVEVARLLLDRGASVDHQNNDRCTSLFYTRHMEILELLLSRGADTGHQNCQGRTPLAAAVQNFKGHYLSRAGLDVRKSRLEMVQLLVKNGANIGHKDKNGQTVLELAMTDTIGSWTQGEYSPEEHQKLVNEAAELHQYMVNWLVKAAASDSNVSLLQEVMHKLC